MWSEFIAKVRSKGFARPNRFAVTVNVPVGITLQKDATRRSPFSIIARAEDALTGSPTSVFDAINTTRGFDPNAGLKTVLNVFGDIRVVSFDNSKLLQLSCESAELPGKSLATVEPFVYGPLYKMPYNQIFGEMPLVFKASADMFEKKFFDTWQSMVIDPNSHDVRFYNEYTSTVKIDQLNQRNEVIYSITLEEAYPVTVSPMNLDYSETDSVHKLAVSMAYRKWTVNKV